MLTSGQASFLHQTINSYIALLFVAVFALMVGLMIWNASFGYNPLARALTQESAATSSALQY